MPETLKDKFEKVTEKVSSDEVRKAIEDIIGKKEKPEKIADLFLEEVGFWEKLRQHPLVTKVVDWGNTSKNCKKSAPYKKIQEKLTEILSKQKVEPKEIIEVRNLLSDLKDEAINFIIRQASDVRQGLRHIHAPGSVARDEARNLYYGEKFKQDTLHELASRLVESIALGNTIGIYSDDERFMRNVKQLIGSLGLGPSFKIDPARLWEIGIRMHEVDYPHVVFLKLVLWLRRQIDTAGPDKREILSSILERLRVAPISIFFMPDTREKWCTIGFPRLDFFIDRWIQNDEARKNLEKLVGNVDGFVTEVRRKVEASKARNIIDLLMNQYEIFCRKLIEHGTPEPYALRNMLDIMVTLSVQQGIKVYMKPLPL